jgi:putative heme-binding domain-containing protein
VQLDILTGLSESLRGRRSAPEPDAWPDLEHSLAPVSDPELRNKALDLGVLFGDQVSVGRLRQMAENQNIDTRSRQFALQTLVDHKSPDLDGILHRSLSERGLAPIAIRGLSASGDTGLTATLLSRFNDFDAAGRLEAMNALVARPVSAEAVLDAIAAGKLKRTDLTAFHARQISSMGNASLQKKLTEAWGDIRRTPDDKKASIAKFKSMLTPARLKSADASRGRATFNLTCALCHTLYGQGAKIGPDLTGSGRANLDYLLENIVDPSAIVGADFRLSLISLKDGRILNGIIGGKTERTFAIQMLTERTTVERSDVRKIEDSAVSLMPEGLLEGMEPPQIADLIAYLMTPRQVPLPDPQNN